MIVRPMDAMPSLKGSRNWAKVIRRLDDLDLRGRGGWALVAEKLRVDHYVALEPGEFLVVARTDRWGDYHHLLAQADGLGGLTVIYRTGEADDTRLPTGVTDHLRAEAMNWPLFRIALEIHRRLTEGIGGLKRLGRRAIAAAIAALRLAKGDWVPSWREREQLAAERQDLRERERRSWRARDVPWPPDVGA